MGKRGNGEGSIYYQASRERYAAAYQDAAGKRRVIYGKTREDVATALVKALGNAQDGIPQPSGTLTVAKYLDQWLEDAARPRVKPSTLESYREIVRLHLAPGLGKHKLAKLTPQQVQAFLNERAKAQCGGRRKGTISARRVQMMHAILRAALNRALKWQMVSRNVALLVDPPRASKREMQPLTAPQAQQLLEAARGHRHEYLYALLLGTGLRLGEALALRWDDVDMDGRRLKVRRTLQRIRGLEWELSEPKSASGMRTVPLIGPALDALRGQWDRQAFERKAAGEAWQKHGFVFASTIGTPLDGTNVYHEYKRLLATAGVPTTFRVHDLRHSAATYLLAAGVDPRIVMDIMGWSQVSMLARYQHILPAMLDDAAARLEAVFPHLASA